MFRFRLDIAGEIQMDRGIARFADGVSDYRPIWSVVEDDFYALEADQFKTQGAEGGEAWAPLSEAYAAWKEAHYPGRPILERTGDLERSLTNPNDPNTVRIEERKTLTLGTRVAYAIYHQAAKERTSNLPRRPEIMLTEAFKRTVMHHVQTYLVQIASQSGFRRGMGPLSVSSMAAGFMRKGGGSSSPWGRIAGF